MNYTCSLRLQSQICPVVSSYHFYWQSMGLEEAPYVHVALVNNRILTKIFANRIIVESFYHTIWLSHWYWTKISTVNTKNNWAVNRPLPDYHLQFYLFCNLKTLGLTYRLWYFDYFIIIFVRRLSYIGPDLGPPFSDRLKLVLLTTWIVGYCSNNLSFPFKVGLPTLFVS